MFNPQTKGWQQPGQVLKHPPTHPADAPLVLISPNRGWQLRLPGCRSSSLCHFLIRIIFFDAKTRELISEPVSARCKNATRNHRRDFHHWAWTKTWTSVSEKGCSNRTAGTEERVCFYLRMPPSALLGAGIGFPRTTAMAWTNLSSLSGEKLWNQYSETCICSLKHKGWKA